MGLLDIRNLELCISNVAIKCLEHFADSEKDQGTGVAMPVLEVYPVGSKCV